MMKTYRDQDWISPKAEIRPSRIHGKGMFAVAAVAQDEVVAVWGGQFVSHTDAERARLAGRAVQQIDEDVFEVFDRDQTGPSYYHNHSCDPNTGMADEVTVVAMRAIRPGEELTIDYAMFEADEKYVASWECRCGASGCRKQISGRDWRLADLQERYAGYLSPLITRRWTKRLSGILHSVRVPDLKDALVTLERADEQNVDLLARWTTDPVAQGPYKRVPMITIGDLRMQILQSPDRQYFLIRRNADGKPLGRFYYRAWCFLTQTDVIDWEVNILLAEPTERGRGYGTAVQQMAADYLLQQRNTRSVFAYTAPANMAERRALRKAGFAEIGSLPHPYYRVLGPSGYRLFAKQRDVRRNDYASGAAVG